MDDEVLFDQWQDQEVIYYKRLKIDIFILYIHSITPQNQRYPRPSLTLKSNLVFAVCLNN